MPIRERVQLWARALKRDIIALWLAAREPRVPLHARLAAAAVAAYALSPIDLIPDFIPVLGYLDDLLLVPLGILLVIKLIPPPVMADLRREATARAARPHSTAGLLFILALWLAAAAAIGWAVWRHLS